MSNYIKMAGLALAGIATTLIGAIISTKCDNTRDQIIKDEMREYVDQRIAETSNEVVVDDNEDTDEEN